MLTRNASRLAAQCARQHSRGAVRPMTTVVSSSSGSSAAPDAAQPVVVEKVKIVKSEPAPVQFAPAPVRVKSGGGLRTRLASFLTGFAVAAFAGYGFIRGDVMQVAQDIENQIIPVTVTLQSRIGRLEKRIEELEAAKK